MADKKVLWNILELRREVDERMLGVRILPSKTGLGLENQTKLFQLGETRVSAYRFGPDIEMLGPHFWPNISFGNSRPVSLEINNYGSKENQEIHDRENIRISLSPASLAVHAHHRSFEPPPTKPPPHPPDPPLKLLRMDSSGDDPGDLQFPGSGFGFDFKHRLEDKACLKRLAEAVIIQGEDSYVEGWSFDHPPPPPQLPSYLDYGKLECILSEEGNHAGNETQKFFNDFPRPPKIGDEGEQRTSKWAPTRMKDGRESVDLSCATHSLLKAISSKTEQNVDIGYAMRVNAELELHLILMLGRANFTLNRVCEASCYGAFGCIFHPGSKSHLIQSRKITQSIQYSIMTNVEINLLVVVNGVQRGKGVRQSAATTTNTYLQDESLKFPRAQLRTEETPPQIHFSMKYNLEDKVVSKRGGIVRTEITIFQERGYQVELCVNQAIRGVKREGNWCALGNKLSFSLNMRRFPD